VIQSGLYSVSENGPILLAKSFGRRVPL
jgi:hypothetical protein